jgi:hypothetical protein
MASAEVHLSETATLTDVVQAVNGLSVVVTEHTAEEGRIIGKAISEALDTHKATDHEVVAENRRLLGALTDRWLGSPAPDFPITGARHEDGIAHQVNEIKKATDLFREQQANGGTYAQLPPEVLAALVTTKGATDQARLSNRTKVWLAIVGVIGTGWTAWISFMAAKAGIAAEVVHTTTTLVP